MRRSLFLMILLCLAVSFVLTQKPSKAPPKHSKVTELGYRVYQPFRLSPDGRYLSYEDEDGDIFFVRDLKSGEDHPIPIVATMPSLSCLRARRSPWTGATPRHPRFPGTRNYYVPGFTTGLQTGNTSPRHSS